jgi:hypothetical protein
MDTAGRAARHVGTTAGTAERMLQKPAYEKQCCQSRANLLQQASDCLLALQLDVDAAQRQLLWRLFARRMQRAYGGQCQ